MILCLCILLALYFGIALYGSFRGGLDEFYSTLKTESSPDLMRDVLLPAIEEVESGGDSSAVGADGEVGILQIRPIMVEEVNRILGFSEYSDKDRLDPTASRQMFIIYSMHWATHWEDNSLEGIARRWNGGPRGHLKKATEGYWDKVRARTWTESAKTQQPAG